MRGTAGSDQANEVDLINDGQELNIPSAEAAAHIKATVRVLGDTTVPPHLGIALRNSKCGWLHGKKSTQKNEIEFQDLAPGKYEVLAFAPPKAFSVLRISASGNDIPGDSLNVAAGSSLTISLSLAGGAVNVEGLAKRAGKPSPGAMVVLVPKDPESHSDLFRRDQSDQDGSFSLRSVIPGTYTVVAIEDGWDLDWSRPGVIAHYVKHGQTVTVTDRSQSSVHLPDSVEVQPR